MDALSALGGCRVPPIGFNTWNMYDCEINEELIRTTADAMNSTGLLGAGYNYLNMDE